MSTTRMNFSEVGKRRLITIVLSYVVLGMLSGLFNAWEIGQFPTIRSQAEQRLAAVEKTESSTFSQKAKKLAKKWAIKEQINSTSPLVFAGMAIFGFFILHALTAHFLFKKKYKESKYSFPVSITFVLIS